MSEKVTRKAGKKAGKKNGKKRMLMIMTAVIMAAAAVAAGFLFGAADPLTGFCVAVDVNGVSEDFAVFESGSQLYLRLPACARGGVIAVSGSFGKTATTTSASHKLPRRSCALPLLRMHW